MAKVNSAVKVLFSSETRIRLLSYLFLQPEAEFYLRQLEKILNMSVGQLGREILALEKIALLKSTTQGNQKLYCLNKDFPFYDELRGIFIKTTGAGDLLRRYVSRLEGVELVFIYGSFAKGDEHGRSDIDVMIVGGISYRDLSKAISQVENILKREVNYSLYERGEIKSRLRRKDRFLTTVFTEPKIILLGKNDDELFRAT